MERHWKPFEHLAQRTGHKVLILHLLRRKTANKNAFKFQVTFHSDGPYHFIFLAIKGGWSSDMAIDDVILRNGPCAPRYTPRRPTSTLPGPPLCGEGRWLCASATQCIESK